MTRSAQRAPIDEHPDLVSSHARFDQSPQTPQAMLLYGLVFLTGLYIAISPWVVQFSASRPAVTASNLIVGLALAVLALFASSFDRARTIVWVTPLLGVWIIVSQWVIIGSGSTAGVDWNNVVAGAVGALLGLGITGLVAKRAQTRGN